MSAGGNEYTEHYSLTDVGQNRDRVIWGQALTSGTREGFPWDSKEPGHQLDIDFVDLTGLLIDALCVGNTGTYW